MTLIIFAGAEFMVVALFLVCVGVREVKREATGASSAVPRDGAGYATVLRRHRVGALSST